MDHFLHRCTHDAFYKNRNTIKGVDHPCSACAKCIKNRLYDPDPCEVCSQWLKHIKENENSVEAENGGSLWVKWNRSLVSAWKHNKVPNYLVPGVDMLIWADTEKFTLWEPLLPVGGSTKATTTLATNAPLVSNTGLMISVTCVQMVDRN